MTSVGVSERAGLIVICTEHEMCMSDRVDTPFLIGVLYLSFSAVGVTQKLKCSGNYRDWNSARAEILGLPAYKRQISKKGNLKGATTRDLCARFEPKMNDCPLKSHRKLQIPRFVT